MTEELHQYLVSWQHGPAPGLTFYSGQETVTAADIEDAGRRCKQHLKRTACFEPGCIRINDVEYIG